MTERHAAEVVLDVAGLRVEFTVDRGTVRAVRGVDLEVRRGETVAVVGESGSGKSATMLGALGLLGPAGSVTGGTSRLLGVDLLDRRRRRQMLGRDVGIVFQDPLTSLHPSFTVGAQIVEAVQVHAASASRREARARALELLERVGVPGPSDRFDDYPFQWSGGMRQRAMIAMAIAHRPALLVADEPTTALDVTVQAQVLELLRDLREETGMAIVLITHDLGVVAGFADRVAVMYHGRVVERGEVEELYARPHHPYTAALLASVTSIDDDVSSGGAGAIGGSALPVTTEIAGCAFEPRCQIGRGDPRCAGTRPELLTDAAGHESACHYPLHLPAGAS